MRMALRRCHCRTSASGPTTTARQHITNVHELEVLSQIHHNQTVKQRDIAHVKRPLARDDQRDPQASRGHRPHRDAQLAAPAPASEPAAGNGSGAQQSPLDLHVADLVVQAR
jgi:hypothetical protein